MSSFASVLMVDDSQLWHHALTQLLIGSGEAADVWFASTYDEAIDLLTSHRPDVVIADLRLTPDSMDHQGLTFCNEVQARYPDTRVLLLTGASSAEVVRMAAQKGILVLDKATLDARSLLAHLQRTATVPYPY